MADIDSPRSSRSGRKKSNALARLAAKRRSNQGSDDNASDLGSRSSLGSHLNRSRDTRLPLENDDDNDETDASKAKVSDWQNKYNSVETRNQGRSQRHVFGTKSTTNHEFIDAVSYPTHITPKPRPRSIERLIKEEKAQPDSLRRINVSERVENGENGSRDTTLRVDSDSGTSSTPDDELPVEIGSHSLSRRPQSAKHRAGSAIRGDVTLETDEDSTEEDLSHTAQQVLRQYQHTLNNSQNNHNNLNATAENRLRALSQPESSSKTEEDVENDLDEPTSRGAASRYGSTERATSEVDLRKRSRQLERLHPGALTAEKRTASLSQADAHDSLTGLEEAEDTLAELRLPPRPRGAHSPTPAATRNPLNTTGTMNSVDRPWSARNDYSANLDFMSERSVTSTSALQQISTLRARDRSFLHGSANHGNSLLGAQELERFFPDRKMRVFVGTWNMAEIKQLPSNLDDFVHPQALDVVCDVYAFYTQESFSNRREWELSLQESLGPSHVLYHSASGGILYLCVFIRRDLVWYTSISEEAFTSVRAGSAIKTKGGVGVCFSMFGTSLLFINCHLHAHEANLKVRLRDISAISSQLKLPQRLPQGRGYHQDSDVTARFDNVFWGGDMNFRLDKEESRTKKKIEGLEHDGNYEELLEYDELHKAMALGDAFNKFSEGRIKFRPTYKYEPGTNNFESKQGRIPSYTDRVVFRCKRKGSTVCLQYESVPEIQASDHKPVYGVYEVTLRPGRDNMPLSGGQFDRDIWKTALTRRALRLDLQNTASEKQSSVCSVQ